MGTTGVAVDDAAIRPSRVSRRSSTVRMTLQATITSESLKR
jgi:hypothetical protein